MTEVLRLLAIGLSEAELAGRRYISEATVKSHVSGTGVGQSRRGT
jgi:DNA-binding NarL/FixJ family response regulator